MPAPDATKTAEALALIQAQSAARAEIAEIITGSVRSEVSVFTGWYSSAAITKLVAILAKLTRAGQKQTATSTDAYAARMLRLTVGKAAPVGPVAVDDLWGGVPLESVYGRLADQFRYLQATRGPSAPTGARISLVTSEPLPELSDAQILDRVLLRSEQQADTALSLAFRDQWAADLADAPAVTGYRRVLHPELARKSGTCGLCIAASAAVYNREALLPIHTFCNCEVAPIVGDPDGPGDPGGSLNASDLKRFYVDAGKDGKSSTKGKDLRATKYVVRDHPEKGPTLTFAGQNWRGPKDVAASS